MRTTQLDDDDNFDVIPKNFPMYTVPLGTLLDMTQIEPHEDLKARAALVEFQRNMGRAAFVSHQWVTTDHPDPECKQMRILQDALKGMMYGKTAPYTTGLSFRSDGLACQGFTSIRPFVRAIVLLV